MSRMRLPPIRAASCFRASPRPGGSIHFRWKHFGADRVTASEAGPVFEAAPGRRFAFGWRPGGHRTRVEERETGCPPTPGGGRPCLRCAGRSEALKLLKFYLERKLRFGVVPPPPARRPQR